MARQAKFTVYFVGDSKEEALEGMAWDTWTGAEEYRKDNEYKKVYSASVTIRAERLSIA